MEGELRHGCWSHTPSTPSPFLNTTRDKLNSTTTIPYFGVPLLVPIHTYT